MLILKVFLLCIAILLPRAQAVQRACGRVFETPARLLEDLREYEVGPKHIPPSEIKDVKAIKIGKNNVFQGTYQGRLVFIKISSMREAAYWNVLNKIGKGALLFGVSKVDPKWTTDNTVGDRVIVAEWVEGRHFHAEMYYYEHLEPSKKSMREYLETFTIEELERLREEIVHTARTLDENFIYGLDLQFMITPDKQAVLVDPEFFSVEPSRSDKSQQLARLMALIIDRVITLRKGQPPAP
jgi:hypothetical protein